MKSKLLVKLISLLPYFFMYFSLDTVQRFYDPFYANYSRLLLAILAIGYAAVALNYNFFAGTNKSFAINLKSKRFALILAGYITVSLAAYALMHNFAAQNNIRPTSLLFVAAIGGGVLFHNLRMYYQELPTPVTIRKK